jgi:hypothetical protein
VSWAWYSGGWNVALADGRQPPAVKRQMIYTRNEAARCSSRITSPSTTTSASPGTPDRAAHIKDGEDFERDIAAGTLPAVSFYKPAGRYTSTLLHRRQERRRAHGRAAHQAARQPAMEGHADRADLRRERRLLGSRAAPDEATAGATGSAPAHASRR